MASHNQLPQHNDPGVPGVAPGATNGRHNGATEKSRKQHSLRHPAENSIQGHLVAGAGEFVGTFMFLFIAYAGHIMVTNHVSPPPTPADPTPGEQSVVIISIAYGFSLLVNVWAFFRISGGLFNPAVTLGLSLSGQVPWLRSAFLFPAQILAAMSAGGLVKAMIPGQAIGNANTVLGSGTTIAQGVFLEMFFTAQLVFVVLMLAMEKSKETPLAPIGIGLTQFVVMVAGTAYTGGSLNPARSFGCAVASYFPGYHWIYWVGPALGGVLAAAFYRFVKFFHYEEVNPVQDATDGRETA